jgi:hypothetical protein
MMVLVALAWLVVLLGSGAVVVADASGYASIAAPATPTTFPHDVCRTNAQCLNGGVCHVVHGDTSPHRSSSQGAGAAATATATSEYNYCTCHAGYGGQRCESYCPLRCQNGGLCHAKQASSSATGSSIPAALSAPTYSCQCMGRWSGTICDVPYDNCFDGSQCFHGGHCRVRNETITVSYCDCPSGWGGVACQEKVTSSLPSETPPSSVWSKGLVTYGSLAIVLVATTVVSALFLVLRRRSRTTSYKTVQVSDAENEETIKAEPSKEEKWRNVV